MTYTDGFLIVVPKKKILVYKKVAAVACEIWKDHGALDYKECVAKDLKITFGKPFPSLLKLRASETVVFSWITYKNRTTRDRVNAKVMKDPRMTGLCDPKKMPFDMKRFSYGGFEVFVDPFNKKLSKKKAPSKKI